MRFLAFLPALIAVPAAAQPCGGTAGGGNVRVTVEVTGVRDARGNVTVTVYPDLKAKFLKKGTKLARVRVPAVAGTTVACLWLPPGGYPFAIYHDQNNDRDFNRTLFVPREGYGFSNDAPTTFGLPSFERVRVPVTAGGVVRIRMRYP